MIIPNVDARNDSQRLLKRIRSKPFDIVIKVPVVEFLCRFVCEWCAGAVRGFEVVGPLFEGTVVAYHIGVYLVTAACMKGDVLGANGAWVDEDIPIITWRGFSAWAMGIS